MPEFLAEVYVSNATGAPRLPNIEVVIAAADHVTQEGSRVEVLRLIHVSEDETSFYLFSAESEDRVIDVANQAGLHIDRLSEADQYPLPTHLGRLDQHASHTGEQQ